jgi:hypothetical protein
VVELGEPDFGCVEDSLSMENSITKLKNDKSSFPSVLEKYSRLQNEKARPENAYKVFSCLIHCFGDSLVVTRLMLWFTFRMSNFLSTCWTDLYKENPSIKWLSLCTLVMKDTLLP